MIRTHDPLISNEKLRLFHLWPLWWVKVQSGHWADTLSHRTGPSCKSLLRDDTLSHLSHSDLSMNGLQAFLSIKVRCWDSNPKLPSSNHDNFGVLEFLLLIERVGKQLWDHVVSNVFHNYTNTNTIKQGMALPINCLLQPRAWHGAPPQGNSF